MQPDLRHPVGKFSWPSQPLTAAERSAAIAAIARTPANVRNAVRGLSERHLDTPYRDGGWTVRQVVHHLPDSHLNAYARFKLAMTEDNPVIKPYDQEAWANLPDGKAGAIEPSLSMLEGLHTRWVILLESMQPADFARPLRHPEHDQKLNLDMMLAMYAWHGRPHVAHIPGLRERERF